MNAVALLSPPPANQHRNAPDLDALRCAHHAYEASRLRLERAKEAIRHAEDALTETRRELAEVAGQGQLVFDDKLLTVHREPGRPILITVLPVRVAR